MNFIYYENEEKIQSKLNRRTTRFLRRSSIWRFSFPSFDDVSPNKRLYSSDQLILSTEFVVWSPNNREYSADQSTVLSSSDCCSSFGFCSSFDTFTWNEKWKQMNKIRTWNVMSNGIRCYEYITIGWNEAFLSHWSYRIFEFLLCLWVQFNRTHIQ